MHKILFLFLLLLGFLLESMVTTMPLGIMIVVLLFLSHHESMAIALSFVYGILLDTMRVGMIGETTLIYLAILSVIYLYNRKFEVTAPFFVFLVSFCGSIVFLRVFAYPYMSIQAFVLALATTALFLVLDNWYTKPRHDLLYT